jgi:hypothetical protein
VRACEWSEWCVKDVAGGLCLSGVYVAVSTQRTWADGLILEIQVGMYLISRQRDCEMDVVLGLASYQRCSRDQVVSLIAMSSSSVDGCEMQEG